MESYGSARLLLLSLSAERFSMKVPKRKNLERLVIELTIIKLLLEIFKALLI